MLDKYKVIFWDFDGVIMDSMPIRGMGFEKVLADYPAEQVAELMAYHEQNGGLSRYHKFRYFFNTIRGEEITEEQVLKLADSFSEIMLSLLINDEFLINDSVAFIRNNWDKFEMHVVSGSDGNELRKITAELDLAKYFKSVNGSPTPKKQIVKDLLEQYNYDKATVALIGDSKNDHEAAVVNGIDFIGYNNLKMSELTPIYIHQFSDL